MSYVVNSHLHFDHVGGNRHFPGAKTVVSKAELRQAKVPETFERYAYSDQTFDHPEVDFELLEGDRRARGRPAAVRDAGALGRALLAPVEPPSGQALLFAFDAAYAHESLDRLIPSGFHLDPTAAVRSLRRIQALARTYDARIFVAHDAAAFSDYRLAPAGVI